jgi:hypothetical protein
MATHRASKVEKEQRIAQIVRLISNGAVTSELVQFASKEWGVGRRQADAYIAEARQVLIADINQDRAVVVAEMMAVCRTVIKRGLSGDNLNAVLGAVNSIRGMGGLDIPAK